MTDALLAIDIVGHSQIRVAVSTTEAVSSALDAGYYDVWSDADVWIKVGDEAQGVTAENGYVIYPGNVVTVEVQQGHQINVIGDGVGVLSIHRVG